MPTATATKDRNYKTLCDELDAERPDLADVDHEQGEVVLAELVDDGLAAIVKAAKDNLRVLIGCAARGEPCPTHKIIDACTAAGVSVTTFADAVKAMRTRISAAAELVEAASYAKDREAAAELVGPLQREVDEERKRHNETVRRQAARWQEVERRYQTAASSENSKRQLAMRALNATCDPAIDREIVRLKSLLPIASAAVDEASRAAKEAEALSLAAKTSRAQLTAFAKGSRKLPGLTPDVNGRVPLPTWLGGNGSTLRPIPHRGDVDLAKAESIVARLEVQAAANDPKVARDALAAAQRRRRELDEKFVALNQAKLDPMNVRIGD